MATAKQTQASKKNVKKTQEKWQSMTSRQRALRQSEGRLRKKSGMGPNGEYYRIVVRPKSEFVILAPTWKWV
ncbi:MAG: hypothetical protein OEW78_05050 [Nitrosopumilus sp.]|uniref:hypothetical protein n=1 Tax=Nitrosopumilus sp. TaxID=2024843 RepID=UPI00246D87AD|nr:hypothetical protein [Nitrosopumilus sp.]MDH5431235.1 hypothetical protein [Nitrosopumilus sp.]